MSQKKIGTHNGTFHCDEALACFLLHQTKEFAGAEIVRTRDEKVLDQLDVLVDVGGVYNPEKFRFDHHQIGFTATLDEKHPIKLSSAGLVYKHFGREIISNRLGTDERITNLLFYKLYKDFIESIDAIDNGIDQYPKDLQPKYLIRTHLSARVGQLNPWWNDTQPNPEEKFKQAMQLAGSEFLEGIDYYGKAWLPGRSIVEKAVTSRFEVDPSGEIIVLDQFCPWKDHLQDIETDFQVSPPIIYVLFQDFNKTWRIQCVPVKDGSFENRLPLLWKGLREEELSKASETEGGIFVHISGFIGGNKTKEGVLSMARKSLQQPRPQKV